MEYPSLDTAKAGAIRFNTDSIQLEIYDGNQWVGVVATSPDLHTGGTRGLNFGGQTPSKVNFIEYVNIDTTGNAQDFGDLSYTTRDAGSAADTSRAIAFGGSSSGTPTGDTTIVKVTIASTGNSTSFGNLVQGARGADAVNDRTRAVKAGGEHSSGLNNMDYVTIQSEGNSIDFGDMISSSFDTGPMSSPTRGVFACNPSGETMEYITISTLGNSSNFGETTVRRRSGGAASNAVRGFIMGGYNPSTSTYYQSMDYITLATLGNAIDFGDMVAATCWRQSSTSSQTRAIQIAGRNSANNAFVNTIEYVQFASLGNALDFGDPNQNKMAGTATSNGHGGL